MSGFKEKALEGVVMANGENDEMIARRNNRNVIGKKCKVTCHVYNFSSKFKVRDFRVEIQLARTGRAVERGRPKADATKPLCKSIFFKCEQCKESILVTLDKSGNFKAPADCETPKCREERIYAGFRESDDGRLEAGDAERRAEFRERGKG